MTSENFRTNPMFLRNQFNGDGVFQMPTIKKQDIVLENIELIGYDKLNENEYDRIVHFFLDDYKFEILWKDPEPRIERLKQYRAVLSPNFSVYTEMPNAVKIYNTFRSRWCGAYLQSKGIDVIPTVAWGEPETFWYCFDGIEVGSIVAVSTLGVRTEKTLFMQGYNEMLRKIKPSKIICYGQPFEEMSGNIIEFNYAQINNLSKSHYNSPISLGPSYFDNEKKCYIKKVCGYIYNDKGMGGAGGGHSKLPTTNKPNSKLTLYKNGTKIQTRFYGPDGNAIKDIDYTNHGNPTLHPEVPHSHFWDWTNPDKPIRR